MKRLPDEIVDFFKNEGFAICNTIDAQKRPHSSCKGIIKINKNGRIYLMDLYKDNTFKNLKRNKAISLTLVDEHKFRGYCLKGKAQIIEDGQISTDLIKAWEEKLTTRITKRLLKNIKGEKGHHQHTEALLPHPKYMIVVGIEEIVDLKPAHID